jgi:hypothetical protein
MRLFVMVNDQKTYLKIKLPDFWHWLILSGEHFKLLGNDTVYHVREIRGQPERSTITCMVIGALIGIMMGPIGLIFCAAFGGLIGAGKDEKELDHVEWFNKWIVDKYEDEPNRKK